MSNPLDPSQSRPPQAERSLKEILQTLPTDSGHPGVEEIRKIDPEEDERRVVEFTKVSHCE